MEPALAAHGAYARARYILPQFEERTAYGYKRQDPYTKLFEDRIIFLGVQVDDASADDIMAQLLVLESQDPDRDIIMYINSPGGSFTAMTAIYDTMQYIRPRHPDRLPRPGGLGGGGPARGRHAGQAARAAERPHPDPPAGDRRRRRRPGVDIEIQANEVLRMRDLAGGDPRAALEPHRRAGQEATSSATRSSPPSRRVEYGLVDQVLGSRKTSTATAYGTD